MKLLNKIMINKLGKYSTETNNNEATDKQTVISTISFLHTIVYNKNKKHLQNDYLCP